MVGDLHGQVEQLRAVLDALQRLPDYSDRWLVFIGDFLDRGPDPKGGLDLVLELFRTHPKTAAICGNHDFAACGALQLISTPSYTNWDERWVRHYDAASTFASYGVPVGDLAGLRLAMPEAHQKFLVSLPWCLEHPELLFVHAGLDPHTPFPTQLRVLRQKDFTLNRPTWLCSKSILRAKLPPDCPFTVVSGHVQVPRVEVVDGKVLVDTTGGLRGPLSCFLWPEWVVVNSDGQQYELKRRRW